MLAADIDELKMRVAKITNAELLAMHAENEKAIAEWTRDYVSYGTSARAFTRRYLVDSEQRRHVYRHELKARGAL
jgi:hypothetical protein